eukprot:7391733-Prymnesium_polylepis.3
MTAICCDKSACTRTKRDLATPGSRRSRAPMVTSALGIVVAGSDVQQDRSSADGMEDRRLSILSAAWNAWEK